MDSKITYNQPKDIKERFKIANKFINECKINMPVCVDLMNNINATLYGSWPERLYIIKNGEVVYQGGQGPYEYNLKEITSWLVENV